LKKRVTILHTRHFNGSIVVVSQRPTAVHVSARANVSRFYKCERPREGLKKLLHILFFVKTEYQDMVNETVDEDKPIKSTWYWPSKALLNSYNTKYLRGNMDTLNPPKIDVFQPSYLQRWGLLLKIFLPSLKRRKKETALSTPPLKVGVDSSIQRDIIKEPLKKKLQVVHMDTQFSGDLPF